MSRDRRGGVALLPGWAGGAAVYGLLLGLAVANGLDVARITALCLGDVIDQFGDFNSFVIIRNDPAIVTTLVPSRPDYVSLDAAIRNLRVYMPRTYDAYVSTNDVTIMSDSDRKMMRSEWIGWMTDSVVIGGLGFLWLGSIASQDPAFESWEGSTLAEIAPVIPHPGRDIWGSYRLKSLRPEEELMGALPWEDSPPIVHLNTQIPRSGADVLAMSDPLGHPLITVWSPGNGRMLCFSGKFPLGVENWARQWRFFPQAMIYMTYSVAGKALPPDPIIFERLMRSFRELRERNEIILSLLDFAETFGAKVNALYAELTEVAQARRQVEESYVELRYDEALQIADSTRQRQMSLTLACIEAKDKALLWVYAVEWLAILSTLMLSGLMLWTLMIGRRLYTDAGIVSFRRW